MTRKTLRDLAMLVVLMAVPAILLAGANTWTGGRPVGVPPGMPNLLAASQGNPDVVYAGADGRARLLFSGDDSGELLLLNPENTLSARHALHGH